MKKKFKKNITLDGLAGMVKRGFDGTDKRFNEVTKQLKDFKETNSLDHEEIKLRLSQVAYRFELVEIDKRLKRVETKLGFK